MLIRLCMHHVKNPHLIDKMIIIKGLPENLMFRKTTEGDELLPPWQPDDEANIPKSIRHLCEPKEFVKFFQPVRHYDQTYKGFWDKRTALGFKLDYSYGPAQEIWKTIERIIDRDLPRGEKMPVPAIVAPDHQKPFSLEPEDIPVVDLRKPEPVIVAAPVVQPPAPAVIVAVPAPAAPVSFNCDCGRNFGKAQALRMHKMKAHPAREKVEV